MRSMIIEEAEARRLAKLNYFISGPKSIRKVVGLNVDKRWGIDLLAISLSL